MRKIHWLQPALDNLDGRTSLDLSVEQVYRLLRSTEDVWYRNGAWD
jgi:hypothetical protein